MDSLSGTQVFIAVETRVARNFPAGTGTTAVLAEDHENFPENVHAIIDRKRSSPTVQARGAKPWSCKTRITKAGAYGSRAPVAIEAKHRDSRP